jgi:hypothetical protein
MEKNNEPAFSTNYGLTKRELIAAMAMQGLLANPHSDVINLENIAAAAVLHAEDLLRELSTPQP